jgi:(1->4)-alpha-D-glucan 1-alpha-D-glucosylmutase
MAAPRIPASTYRLQFSRRFRFEDARVLVPYLDALGITDLYASPLLQARKGSAHGYDVTDPGRLNRELGSEEEFDDLVRILAGRGMGLLLDIVPNHMAASSENPWWIDVLESGQASPFAPYFDIDWRSSKKSLAGKVLLPILGAPYGRVLEEHELVVRMEKGGMYVHYHGTRLPLSVHSYAQVLSPRLDVLEETYGPEHPAFREVRDLVAAVERLPASAPEDRAALEKRYREEETIKESLWRLCTRRPEVRTWLDENLRIINGRKGAPESFGPLDRLLSAQHYWLSFWRLANEEINYRRFFAVSELVCLRADDPGAFEAAHELVLGLAREGKVTGLRVDHVDGLIDPCVYLERLKNRLSPDTPSGGNSAHFYTVVEKILSVDETLPPEWPVAGTTGYDFLNAVNSLMVSASGARDLDAIYARFLGRKTDFSDIVYESKKLVMETLFAGEMHALGQHLGRLAEQDRYARDLPRKELRQALVEITACFPVYRTYVRGPDLSSRDRLSIGRALRDARRRGDTASAPVFDFLRRVLTLESPSYSSEGQTEEWLRFLMRWQQFTGPIMAKGCEDTALYNYNRLIALSEVGGDPAGSGTSIGQFHRRTAEIASHRPFTMNATSTHDTKRSEDVRARIVLLSELAEEWGKRLGLWAAWNEGLKIMVKGRLVPDRNEEILLYQTLLGAWPLDPEEIPHFKTRLQNYIIKAVREAKVYTRWIRTNPEHESAVKAFVASILEDREGNRFLEDFLPFHRKIAHYGALNSLSQTLLKIASPGVPDFYQGSEIWDFSLVDPDNRRPVDFPRRLRMLNELKIRESQGVLPLVRALLSHWEDGGIKLYLTYKALNLRKERKDLFLEGRYLPLTVAGGKKEHLIAFARVHGRDWAVVAVPRLLTRLSPAGEFPLGQAAWGAKGVVRLPDESPRRWRNLFTGEHVHASGENGDKSIAIHEVLREFPAALLVSADD